MSCTLDTAIWSRDTGQQIPCFDRCQLITIWMSNIKEVNGKPRLHVSVNLLFEVWPRTYHSSRDSVRKASWESFLIDLARTLEPHGMNRRENRKICNLRKPFLSWLYFICFCSSFPQLLLISKYVLRHSPSKGPITWRISARLLKQILKSNSRLHGDFFSPGWIAPRAEKISCNRKEISARAEKQEIIWLPDSPETLRAKFHIWCRD